MAHFKCKDVGMNDHFEVKDDNEEELMRIIELHAQNSHQMTEISPELKEKITKAIKK